MSSYASNASTSLSNAEFCTSTEVYSSDRFEEPGDDRNNRWSNGDDGITVRDATWVCASSSGDGLQARDVPPGSKALLCAMDHGRGSSILHRGDRSGELSGMLGARGESLPDRAFRRSSMS